MTRPRNRVRQPGVLARVQRHGHGGRTAASASRIRVAGLALLIAYLAVAGWLALRPLPVPWVAPANLQPFATIRADLDEGTFHALGGLAGGLARLAPLGVLLPLAAWRPERTLAVVCARAVGSGALISSAIVLLQSGVPGRSVNVDAVLLDSAGIGLACLLAFPLVRAWLRRGHGHGTRWGAPGWGGSVSGTGPHDSLTLRDEPAGTASPRAAGVGIAP